MLPLTAVRLPTAETHDLKARLRRQFQQLSGTDGDDEVDPERRALCGLESLIIDKILIALGRQATAVDPNEVLAVLSRQRQGIHQDEFITAWKNVANTVNSWLPPSLQAA